MVVGIEELKGYLLEFMQLFIKQLDDQIGSFWAEDKVRYVSKVPIYSATINEIGGKLTIYFDDHPQLPPYLQIEIKFLEESLEVTRQQFRDRLHAAIQQLYGYYINSFSDAEFTPNEAKLTWTNDDVLTIDFTDS